MKNETKIDLVTIDPENDFHPGGTLSVDNSDKDGERLNVMIKKDGHKINDWHITWDMHNQIDGGHPDMYIGREGKHPEPFTEITLTDLKNGKWRPLYEPWPGYFLEYAEKLEAKKRYPLMVWPKHCLIGTDGVSLYPPVLESMLYWESSEKAIVDKITKGLNPFCEHYSALRAEVPFLGRPDLGINGDPATQTNTKFVNALKEADIVLFSGQARSHCVRFTFEDVLEEFGPENAKKLVLLEDLCSSVTGFEQQTDDWMHKMQTDHDILITTSEKFWKM